MSASRPPPPAWPILVAGAGVPGLAAALALSRLCGAAVRVTLADPSLDRPRPDGRAYALSPRAVAFLEALGVWPEIAGGAQPIIGMRITDGRLDDVVRPDYLRFDAEADALARMVEAEPLTRALRGACERSGVTFRASAVAAFDAGPAGIVMTLDTGEVSRPALLVAADGARSRIRELAGLAWFGGRYDQSGLAGTVAHEHPHGGIAVQHFLPAGPFALLPLADRDGVHRSSIVWTERKAEAERVLALPEAARAAEIGRRAGPTLGTVTLQGALHAFPLAHGRARRAVGTRLALVGDAAHEIHPLAGQGLNLGLADADSLAREAAGAVRLGLDPGAAPVLDAYDRDRRPATLAMLAATDGLNRLFSNDALPLRTLRDIGLGLVDRSAALKGFFAGRAQGGPSDRGSTAGYSATAPRSASSPNAAANSARV